MKLHELAAQAQTKQVAKVMESYFSTSVDFDRLSRTQARNMLNRVRSLIREHRRDPQFHLSEKNPAYLKLIMMEQGLVGRMNEQTAMIAGDPAKQAALASAQAAQKKKSLQDQMRAVDEQIKTLQKQKSDMQRAMNMPTMEGRITEASEVQQAQVILASKDMVDQVQKMIEQTTAIQFKDLPALVDQIRNEVGYDQATQFNTDATAALSGMVQNLQGAKTQLEAALGVVTGQAPQVPGADMAAGAPAPTVPEVPADGEEVDMDAELDVEEPTDLETSLGRAKR